MDVPRLQRSRRILASIRSEAERRPDQAKRVFFVLGNAATLRRADEIWSLFWADAEKRGVAIRALQPYGLHSFDRWERIEYVSADIVKVEEKQQVRRSPEVKLENAVKGSDSVVDLTLDKETDPRELATEPPGPPIISTQFSSKPVKRRPDQSTTPSWLHEP